jgi:hypothetical protein
MVVKQLKYLQELAAKAIGDFDVPESLKHFVELCIESSIWVAVGVEKVCAEGEGDGGKRMDLSQLVVSPT